MTYEGMAADVLRFLDEHELEKAALIGHSMGGKCAMQLALSHPLRIERLVVVDIAPRGYPFWQGYLEAMSSLDVAGLATREDADLALRSAIASRLYRQFLLSNLNRSPKGGYFWKVNLKALLAGATTLAGEITARGTYDGPALFMRGGQADQPTLSGQPTGHHRGGRPPPPHRGERALYRGACCFFMKESGRVGKQLSIETAAIVP